MEEVRFFTANDSTWASVEQVDNARGVAGAVQWNGCNKAINLLDKRAGVLIGYCICLMTAGDKGRLLTGKLHCQQVIFTH